MIPQRTMLVSKVVLLAIIASSLFACGEPAAPIREPISAHTTDWIAKDIYNIFDVGLFASSNCVMPGETLHLELTITNITTQTLEFAPPLTFVWIIQAGFFNDFPNGFDTNTLGQPAYDWPNQQAVPVEINRLSASEVRTYTWDWVVPDVQPDRTISFGPVKWSMYAGFQREDVASPQPPTINEYLTHQSLSIPYLNVIANDRSYTCAELRQP